MYITCVRFSMSRASCAYRDELLGGGDVDMDVDGQVVGQGLVPGEVREPLMVLIDRGPALAHHLDPHGGRLAEPILCTQYSDRQLQGTLQPALLLRVYSWSKERWDDRDHQMGLLLTSPVATIRPLPLYRYTSTGCR